MKNSDRIEVRQADGEEDELKSLEIFNRVWPWNAYGIEEARHFKSSSIDYGAFLGLLDKNVAGALDIALTPERPHVGFVLLSVLPRHRGHGVGTALFQTAQRWLAERSIPQAEWTVPEDDDASLAWARRHGLHEVERNSRLVLELRDYTPPPLAPPPGIHISTWAERPELASGMYDVAREAEPDIPGSQDEVMEPFEEWLQHDMGGSGDRPEATFVAIAGEEVVGYAKFSLSSARPKEADHDLTGVKRAWRGRGIAGALKRAQVAWAKAAGYERLVTQNEVRNEPIRRLNERLGYKLAPGRVLMSGPVQNQPATSRVEGEGHV